MHQIGSYQKARVILWLVKEIAVIHLAREGCLVFCGFTVILFCPVGGQKLLKGLAFSHFIFRQMTLLEVDGMVSFM